MVQVVTMDSYGAEVPLIVGNRPCTRCPQLEHSACLGCHKVYCRNHAMTSLSWSRINYGGEKLSLVLCQGCLDQTILVLNTAQINLRMLAEYETL